MDLSITTDYARGTGDPSPYLRRIAEHGFTHVHWCHQWNTDFLYARPEIDQIERWLTDYGLQLLDLHGSDGREKNWASTREYERLAGVELVRNRLEMAARLQSGVVIMHAPADPNDEALRRSLDDLLGVARDLGVRIALENGGNADSIQSLLSEYDETFLGLCYDAGHGNVDGDGLDQLAALGNRLLSVHLHDNDGTGDQHNLLFTGTADWARIAQLIAKSAYTKCVSMEVVMGDSGIGDEGEFLKRAFTTGMQLSEMIERSSLQ